jgi:hypothetical protein
MQKLVAIIAALCCIGATTAVQGAAKPRVVYIHPGPHTEGSTAIVIPAGSTLKIAKLPSNGAAEVSFRGRVTLSGVYNIDGEETISFWPDQKSREILPHWDDRGIPDEIFISNGSAFTEAVVPKDKLHRLAAGKLDSVRGRVTIIADNYETSIECDVVYASVRFVSVVKAVEIASIPESQETC